MGRAGDGGTLIKTKLSRIPQKGAHILMPSPHPQHRKCLSICLCPLPGQWIFLADNIPRHNSSPENWRWWCHVLGGVLCHSVSQHLTTEMYYAHRGTKVNIIPRICPPLHSALCGDIYTALYFSLLGLETASAQWQCTQGWEVTPTWECLIMPLCKL